MLINLDKCLTRVEPFTTQDCVRPPKHDQNLSPLRPAGYTVSLPWQSSLDCEEAYSLRGRRRKGRGKEGKGGGDWREKERDLSSFLVRAFLPAPFSGDCLCSTVVESSEETAQTFPNTSRRLTLNCIRNLVSTVLSDPAFSQPRGCPVGRVRPWTLGPWERGCFYARSIIDIFVECLQPLSSTCSRSYG